MLEGQHPAVPLKRLLQTLADGENMRLHEDRKPWAPINSIHCLMSLELHDSLSAAVRPVGRFGVGSDDDGHAVTLCRCQEKEWGFRVGLFLPRKA